MKLIYILFIYTAWVFGVVSLVLHFTGQIQLSTINLIIYSFTAGYFPGAIYRSFKSVGEKHTEVEEEPEYIKVILYDNLLKRMQVRIVHKSFFDYPTPPKWIAVEAVNFELLLYANQYLIDQENRDTYLEASVKYIKTK
jgi:hypothetical protein